MNNDTTQPREQASPDTLWRIKFPDGAVAVIDSKPADYMQPYATAYRIAPVAAPEAPKGSWTIERYGMRGELCRVYDGAKKQISEGYTTELRKLVDAHNAATGAAPLVPEVAASEQQTVAPPCPWCEKRALAPSHKDGTVQNYQCGECLNFSHAATTASADDSEFLATLQGAAKEATDEWIVGFVRQHFGIYAATTETCGNSHQSPYEDAVSPSAGGVGSVLVDAATTASASDSECFYTFSKPDGWVNLGNPGQTWEEWTRAQGIPTTKGWNVSGRATAPSRNAAPASIDSEPFRSVLGAYVGAMEAQESRKKIEDHYRSIVIFVDAQIRAAIAQQGAAQAAHAGTARNMEIDAETIEQLKKGRWCEVSGEPRNAWAEAYDAKHGIDAVMSAATEQKEKP